MTDHDTARDALEEAREFHARALDALDRAVEALTPPAKATLRVHGELLAHLDGGGITRLVFLPAAGDAGYMGRPFDVVDGRMAPIPVGEARWLSDALAQFFATGGDIDWEG